MIDATLKGISPIRAIANVVHVGSAGYRKLVTQNGVTSGWAAETAARPETDDARPSTKSSPALASFMPIRRRRRRCSMMRAFDVEGWLASEIATEFAKAEGTAFVNGNGTNKPQRLPDRRRPRPPAMRRAPLARCNISRRARRRDFVGIEPAGQAGRAGPRACARPIARARCWVMNAVDARHDPQVQDHDGAFIWQAGLVGGAARYAARLSGGRGRGYARYRREQRCRLRSAISRRVT